VFVTEKDTTYHTVHTVKYRLTALPSAFLFLYLSVSTHKTLMSCRSPVFSAAYLWSFIYEEALDEYAISITSQITTSCKVHRIRANPHYSLLHWLYFLFYNTTQTKHLCVINKLKQN